MRVEPSVDYALAFDSGLCVGYQLAILPTNCLYFDGRSGSVSRGKQSLDHFGEGWTIPAGIEGMLSRRVEADSWSELCQHTSRLTGNGWRRINHFYVCPYYLLNGRLEERVVGAAEHQMVRSSLDQRLQALL